MEYRVTIFYIALALILGSIAEIYVRTKGLGEKHEKIRGVVITKKPRLGPPIAVLVIAIVAAIMTIPR